MNKWTLEQTEVNRILAENPEQKSQFEKLAVLMIAIKNGEIQNETLFQEIEKFVCKMDRRIQRSSEISQIFTPETKEELMQAISDYEILSNNDELTQRESERLNSIYDIENWNVENITDMDGIFENSSLDINLNNWNTSNVTTMKNMFKRANNFNNGGNPLTFNTSNVENMEGMFLLTASFDQSVNALNVEKVRNIVNMFGSAIKYNNGGQPLTLDFTNIKNSGAVTGFLSNAENFANGGEMLNPELFDKKMRFMVSLCMTGTEYVKINDIKKFR